MLFTIIGTLAALYEKGDGNQVSSFLHDFTPFAPICPLHHYASTFCIFGIGWHVSLEASTHPGDGDGEAVHARLDRHLHLPK